MLRGDLLSLTRGKIRQTSTDPEVMKTVAAIKNTIGQAADSCETTRDKLVSLTSLDLRDNKIVGFTRLLTWVRKLVC